MDYRAFLKQLLFLIIIFFSISTSNRAQDYGDTYRLTPAPDVWYNSIDGVRLGIRVLGEMEGAFNEGPHRLDAGFWLGTKFPDNPISYYLNFIEPINSISSFGEEASIQAISTIREGLSSHAISFNKRWQNGFDEREYFESKVSVIQEKMFDNQYRPFPNLWQNEWKSLLALNIIRHKETDENNFEFEFDVLQNIHSNNDNFTVINAEIWNLKRFESGLNIGLRSFFGYATANSNPEYLFTASYAQPISWLNNGVSRSKGTIPNNWLSNGLAHVSGGANLRGYTDTKYSELTIGGFNSVWSINGEFDFPNPINSALKNQLIGDFVFLKSYLFADVGTVFENNPLLVDAGVGLQFSINIPDFLGKTRGFALRYEVPFWISEPDNGNNNFKFRNLIGFGAVISL